MFGQHDGQDDGTQPQHQDLMPAGPMNDTAMGGTSMPAGQPANDGAPMDTQLQAAASSSLSGRAADAATPEDLITIKQEALQNLKPLVSHLDQSPEEAFRMTMMMIQATDDQGLIPKAYEAAKAIPDEKARAQALLDVVNEINYFTSQNTQNS